ncbi:MAG: rhomboid family intramembrane serine protease [Oscillospiraceae bacterium]|nr:rhomboid family intramembrane serine protease [Oscillospiraceae bacterium]
MDIKEGVKKLHYNSPVVLTYAIVCVVLLLINYLTAGFMNRMFLVSYGHPNLLDPLTYLRAFLHVLGHADWSHLFNNMILMMLVGPIVEERYGSGNLTFMILVNAVVTAVINGLFFNTGIIGASGVVFMMIILSAFTGMQKGKVPVTLIIVALMYLGREISTAITSPNDGISQMGHIVGGVVGLIFGIIFYKMKFGGKKYST